MYCLQVCYAASMLQIDMIILPFINVVLCLTFPVSNTRDLSCLYLSANGLFHLYYAQLNVHAALAASLAEDA